MKVRAILLCALTLLLTGCLVKQPVVDVRMAENIRRSTDGRIFVTGHDGLFELHRQSSGTVEATQVASGPNCERYAGLAQLHDWMFFVCVRQSGLSLRNLEYSDAGELLAYSLKDGSVVSTLDLGNYQFPNGLDALVSENAILIGDENLLLPRGGLSKAQFDFQSGTPVLTDYQHHWLDRTHGVTSVNGVRVVDDAIYVTDLGRFKKIPLRGDGSAEPAQTLFSDVTVLDDFDTVCNGFLVTDFVKGRVVYISRNGSRAVISQAGLSTPSALLGNSEPLFTNDEILITESVGTGGKTGDKVVSLQLSQLGVSCKEP